MRLTGRGWVVVAIIVGSIATGWQYGPRTLNAVVTPLFVVLVAGAITTARATQPRISRSPVDEGSVGETRTITVTIATEQTVSATLEDTVDDGLSAADPTAAMTLEGETEFSYELTLDERGAHQVGPLSITIVDLFGLVERRFTNDETSSVLVYPPIYDLHGESDRELQLLADTATRREREEFDHLREYQRGDSLRDVHWKSAAKRPDDELVVTEYADGHGAGSATVAAECIPGSADEMAAAVASVAAHLLTNNVRVGLCLPTETREPGSSRDHQYELLGLLAVVESGELEEQVRTNADVLVQADANGTRIVVADRTIPFDQLRGGEGTVAGRLDRVQTEPSGRESGDDDGGSPSEVTS